MKIKGQLIHGDVLTELKLLKDASVQSIIADPPYFNVLEKEAWDTQWKSSNEYLDWTDLWVGDAMRVLRDDGLCFIFGQLGKREHTFLHLMSRLSQQHQFHDLIIWDRAVGYNERRDSFTPQYEMALVLRKGDDVKFNKEAVRIPYDPETITAYLRDTRYKDMVARREHLEKGKFATNILRIPSLKGTSKEKCGHPSQKPLALIEKLVLCSTDEGDVVLDPFLGSGTTAVAAQFLNREWIGIERDPEYIKMVKERIAKPARRIVSQTPNGSRSRIEVSDSAIEPDLFTP